MEQVLKKKKKKKAPPSKTLTRDRGNWPHTLTDHEIYTAEAGPTINATTAIPVCKHCKLCVVYRTFPMACPANSVLFPAQCTAYDIGSDGRCGSLFGIASNISDLFLRPFRCLLVMFASAPDRKHRDSNGKNTYNL